MNLKGLSCSDSSVLHSFKNTNISCHHMNQPTSWDETSLSTAYWFYCFRYHWPKPGKNFSLASFHTICAYSNWVSITESRIGVGSSQTILRHFTVWMQWEWGLLGTVFQHGHLNVLMISYCSFLCSVLRAYKKVSLCQNNIYLLHQEPFT